MIVKRGEYYHYQFQINGKRYRGSTKSTNKAEALRLEAAQRVECLRNPEQHVELREKLEFDGAFDLFLMGKSPRQTKNTPAIPSFGQTSDRLFRSDTNRTHEHQAVESFKSVRAGECTSAGVNRDLACLRTFRNWCVRMSYPIGPMSSSSLKGRAA